MTTKFKPIGLGDRVRDPITGFSGIIICVTTWLYGCIRIGVQPEELHKGKPVEDKYFDQGQLELVEANVHEPMVLGAVTPPEPETCRSTGGPPRESAGFNR